MQGSDGDRAGGFGPWFLRHALASGRQILVGRRRRRDLGWWVLADAFRSGRQVALVERGGAMDDPPYLTFHRPAIPGDPAWPSAARMAREDEDALRSPPAGRFVDLRPDLDVEAVLSGQASVFAWTSHPSMGRWFDMLALAATEASVRDGRPPPIVLGDEGRGEGWGREAPEGWVSFSVEGDLFKGLPPEGPCLEAGSREAAEAWESMLEDRRRQVTVEERDGVVTASGFGVRAHLVRAGCYYGYDHGKPDADPVVIAAFGPDGVMRGFHQWSGARFDEGRARSLAIDACLAYPCAPGSWDGAGWVKASSCRDVVKRLRGGMVAAPEHLAALSRMRDDEGQGLLGILQASADNDPSPYVQSWASTVRRRQFLLAYPSFMEGARDPEVTRLVDAGLPVVARLAELMGTTPAIARRFASDPRCHAGMEDPDAWPWVGSLLDGIGHGALPREGERFAWLHLFETLGMLNVALADGEAPPAGLVASYAMSLPGRTWTERRASVSRLDRVGATQCRDFLRRGLTPWLCDVARTRRKPALRLAILREYGTLWRLLDAVEAWHGHPVLLSSAGVMPPHASWPMPFGRIELPGADAMALGSMPALVAEGAFGPDADGLPGLAHCVASYGEACARGESLIVSFRARGTGERLSTLELRPSPSGSWRIGRLRYEAAQHKGRRNGNPPPVAVAACEALRGLLSSGHPVDASALGTRSLAAGASLSTASVDLLPVWRPLLPPGWRRLDAEGIRARVAELKRGRPDRPDAQGCGTS